MITVLLIKPVFLDDKKAKRKIQISRERKELWRWHKEYFSSFSESLTWSQRWFVPVFSFERGMGNEKLELQNKQLNMSKIMKQFFSFKCKMKGHRLLSVHDIKSSSNWKKTFFWPIRNKDQIISNKHCQGLLLKLASNIKQN